MINQKEENNNFQEQLTELKKEKSILSQMISASFKRCEGLNEEVGHYWYHVNINFLSILHSFIN